VLSDDPNEGAYLSKWRQASRLRRERKSKESREKDGLATEEEKERKLVGMEVEEGVKDEQIEKEEEEEDFIGGDPPNEYLAQHRFIVALKGSELRKDSFPLHSKNANNRTLYSICLEIWSRDWGNIVGAVFSFLVRNIRCDLSEPVLKNTEIQFSHFLSETDNVILGSAGWTQNTLSFWNSKLISPKKEDTYYKIIADIELRLCSSPTSSSEIERKFAWLDSFFSASRTKTTMSSLFFSIQLLDKLV
jgi:hypothetical protein